MFLAVIVTVSISAGHMSECPRISTRHRVIRIKTTLYNNSLQQHVQEYQSDIAQTGEEMEVVNAMLDMTGQGKATVLVFNGNLLVNQLLAHQLHQPGDTF